ncbi:aspartic proteinase-like protein 2 [Quillaja saponaria]|uniref:Aspartic proteinase-like protein 2 n=1 Tax=Quillaja saponaria TaxID=32244 RepID=A0AAD7PAP4_QUISA|nr:aspartic proteinase-like protein 2 [Quillaja saponaria]
MQITSVVPQSVHTFSSRGNQCYVITSSVTDIFPQYGIMVLYPNITNCGGHQLVLRGPMLAQQGFQKIKGQGITILGDLVLKDKIFVYDLANKRIGWSNYDCSMSVNVSASSNTGRSEYVNTGQLSDGTSLHRNPYQLITLGLLAFLMHISTIHSFLFL